MAIELDLHNALNSLLRYARRHAVKSSAAAAIDCASGGEWRPSSGQVAAAVLAALSAFLVSPSSKVGANPIPIVHETSICNENLFK